MTQLLLKTFVGRNLDVEEPAIRANIGKLSGAVGMFSNVLLFILKLVIGILAGSVSIMADALNNLSDATGAIVTLLGFKLAERPADAHHPYGHARYEYLSGLAVAAIIIVIGFELAKTSAEKIIHPVAVEFSLLTMVVLCASIGLKVWLAIFNRKLGKLICSQTLEAAAVDSRNDCLATSAVLIAGLTERVSGLQVDGFMGLAVAVFILYSGCQLAKQTISPLLGEATDPYLRECIENYVNSNPKVLGYHDLMVHDYGPGQRFASLHVEMDKDEDPLLCHEIIDAMERECLKNHGIHLVVHYDPVVTGDPEQERMRALVTAILRVRDGRMSVHDFRMAKEEKVTSLIFDVALPMELQGQEEAIRSALEAALNDLGERTYTTDITFDPAAFDA
ncbi:MAG: cation transporter [Oscillospiraceae bacterium]|nr:cation transporter [Oscillospiraceae bacterium]